MAMLQAWISLLRRFYNHVRHRMLHRGRPPTPQLTSLGDADRYQSSRAPQKLASFFSNEITSPSNSSKERSIGTGTDGAPTGTELQNISKLEKRPTFERVTSDTGLLSPLGTASLNHPTWRSGTPQSISRTGTPTIEEEGSALSPSPSPSPQAQHRLSQIQPDTSSDPSHSYVPSREAPSPPPRHSVKMRPSERFSNAPTVVARMSATSAGGKSNLSIQRTASSKVRGRISAPVPQSFVHVNGAFVEQDGRREGPSGPNDKQGII